MVKWLRPGPRLISRLVTLLKVMPPGSFAPTGPSQALASTFSAVTETLGPPMQRLAPMPNPVMRNWFSLGTMPSASAGPNRVASKNIWP